MTVVLFFVKLGVGEDKLYSGFNWAYAFWNDESATVEDDVSACFSRIVINVFASPFS